MDSGVKDQIGYIQPVKLSRSFQDEGKTQKVMRFLLAWAVHFADVPHGQAVP